jgi:hypothetical protein
VNNLISGITKGFVKAPLWIEMYRVGVPEVTTSTTHPLIMENVD